MYEVWSIEKALSYIKANERILTQSFEMKRGVSMEFTRRGVDSDTDASPMRQMSSKLTSGQSLEYQ